MSVQHRVTTVLQMGCALMLTDLFNVNANKDLLEMAKHVMVGYKLTTSSS